MLNSIILESKDFHVNEKLIKRQNDIIKSLNNEIAKLKRKCFSRKYLDVNKKFNDLRQENQHLVSEIENLSNKKLQKVDKSTETNKNEEIFTERKEFIEFILKNRGRKVLLNSEMSDVMLKLILENDTPNHPELLQFVKD